MARKLHAENEASREWQTAPADQEWMLKATIEDLREKLKSAEKFGVRCTVQEEKMVEQSRAQDEKLRSMKRKVEDLRSSQRSLLQELIQLARHDEIRGDYEQAKGMIRTLQRQARHLPTLVAGDRPVTSTAVMTSSQRRPPSVSYAATPIAPTRMQASHKATMTFSILRQQHVK